MPYIQLFRVHLNLKSDRIVVMKLTEKEAEEAKKRLEAYKHSCVIEGIHPTEEEEKLFKKIHDERMGYDEGVQFVEDYLVEQGIIDENFHSKNKK